MAFLFNLSTLFYLEFNPLTPLIDYHSSVLEKYFKEEKEVFWNQKFMLDRIYQESFLDWYIRMIIYLYANKKYSSFEISEQGPQRRTCIDGIVTESM
jgi:hypothetical protein